MIARFNPTGTHIQKGFLKVRIDLFPDIGDKTYEMHYVLVPVIPPEGYPGKVDEETGEPLDWDDYNKWIDGLPKIWQLNPALSHFIKIGEVSTKVDLIDYLGQIFNPTIIKTLDDSLVLPNSAHLISSLMRSKAALTTKKIVTKDIEDLILSVNSRFARLALQKDSGDEGLSIVPQTIDVGAAATARGKPTNCYADTLIAQVNPANDTGVIDVVESYWTTSAVTAFFGLFEETSSDHLICNDSEGVGALASGSKRTSSGLTIAVTSGEYIGVHDKTWAAGIIHGDYGGGTGFWNQGGEHIDPTDEADYNVDSGHDISCYGTGDVAGGQDYPISTSCGLTASATVARAVAWDRGMSPGLTISATILKGWGRAIATSADLTISAVVAYLIAFDRTITSNLTAAVSIVRTFPRAIATIANLTISATVVKSWGRAITTSPGLTVSATIIKTWGRKITTSADLTINATISKLIAFKRAVSANLTISATIGRAIAYKRAVIASLTVAVTIAISTGWKIATNTALAVSATISRVMAYSRSIQSALSVAVARWVSPTGHNDPDSAWSDETKAYDDNITTRAYNTFFNQNHYLELTLGSAIPCSAVRVYATEINGGTNDPDIDVDVDYHAAWHNIHSGSITKLLWVTITIPGGPQSILKARIKFNNLLFGESGRVYEFDFLELDIIRTIAYKRATQAALSVAVSLVRIVAYRRAVSAGLTIAVSLIRTFGRYITTTANLVVSVSIRVCTVLRELLRVPMSRLSTVITPISRLSIIRLPMSKLARWRRGRSCSDDS